METKGAASLTSLADMSSRPVALLEGILLIMSRHFCSVTCENLNTDLVCFVMNFFKVTLKSMSLFDRPNNASKILVKRFS